MSLIARALTTAGRIVEPATPKTADRLYAEANYRDAAAIAARCPCTDPDGYGYDPDCCGKQLDRADSYRRR